MVERRTSGRTKKHIRIRSRGRDSPLTSRSAKPKPKKISRWYG